MKKSWILILSAILIMVVGLITRFIPRKTFVDNQKTLIVTELLLNLWRDGGDRSFFHEGCRYLPKEGEYDIDYFRCNPLFIQCVLEKRATEGQLVPLSYNSGLFFKIAENGDTLFRLSDEHELLLKNSCHEVELPNKKYVYFKQKEPGEQVRFDTFDQKILIDKYLVTFKDLWILGKSGSFEIAEKIPGNPTLWNYPAVGLSATSMEKYCATIGKEIVWAHLFDAASMYQEINTTSPNDPIVHAPYVWSHRRDGEFLYVAHYKNKFEFKKEYCEKIVTKECPVKDFWHPQSRETISWTGVTETMGGIFEYQKNIFEPERNLKASSFYFKAESLWHQLGKRAYWDGHGGNPHNFKFINFNFGDKGEYAEPPTPIEARPILSNEPFWVGFRCMRRGLN